MTGVSTSKGLYPMSIFGRRLLALCLAAGLSAAAAATSPRQVSGDALTVETLLLALDRLQAERWYPETDRPSEQVLEDRRLVQAALNSLDPAIRSVVVRGLGRFEDPKQIPLLAVYLGDLDSGVRIEAANALVMAAHHGQSADVAAAFDALYHAPSAVRPDPSATVLTVDQLSARIGARAETPGVVAMRREALARLPLEHGQAQQLFFGIEVGPWSQPCPPAAAPSKILPMPGGAYGAAALSLMLTMLQHDGALELSAKQLCSVRELAWPTQAPTPGPVPEAVEVLLRTGHVDPQILFRNALYHCEREMSGDPKCGWQNRLAAARGLTPLDPFLSLALDRLLRDPVAQVRIQALRQVAAVIPTTHACGPLLDAIADEMEVDLVRAEAIGLLDIRCDEREAIGLRLESLVKVLFDGTKGAPPLSLRAFETLASIAPARAEQLLADLGVGHERWQVRVAAARVADTLDDVKTLHVLAIDGHPRVRVEALGALHHRRDADVARLALENLSSTDAQLVHLSALALKELPPAARPAALVELNRALKRLTEPAADTSRIPRLEILDRLLEWSVPDGPVAQYYDDLRALLRDFDPLVASQAAKILTHLTGLEFRSEPVRRRPMQPSAQELRELPHAATITLQSLTRIELKLLPEAAPLAVARFQRLVKAGYFDGQVLFYRLRLLETAEGGSPDANELSGDARFLRDEFSVERHTAGAVGLLEHGRDTADGRFFLDLMDQPGLDFEATVFARVGDVVPAVRSVAIELRGPVYPWNLLLEGGTIFRIELR